MKFRFPQRALQHPSFVCGSTVVVQKAADRGNCNLAIALGDSSHQRRRRIDRFPHCPSFSSTPNVRRVKGMSCATNNMPQLVGQEFGQPFGRCLSTGIKTQLSAGNIQRFSRIDGDFAICSDVLIRGWFVGNNTWWSRTLISRCSSSRSATKSTT